MKTGDTELVNAEQGLVLRRRVIIELLDKRGRHELVGIPDDDEENAAAVMEDIARDRRRAAAHRA